MSLSRDLLLGLLCAFTCSDTNVIVQVKIWHLPVDVAHNSVCDPSTTMCTGDSTVDIVLWNPVAENVLASAVQQCIKIYDVEQQTARIGNFLQLSVANDDITVCSRTLLVHMLI